MEHETKRISAGSGPVIIFQIKQNMVCLKAEDVEASCPLCIWALLCSHSDLLVIAHCHYKVWISFGCTKCCNVQVLFCPTLRRQSCLMCLMNMPSPPWTGSQPEGSYQSGKGTYHGFRFHSEDKLYSVFLCPLPPHPFHTLGWDSSGGISLEFWCCDVLEYLERPFCHQCSVTFNLYFFFF